jgi:hypothetical protein
MWFLAARYDYRRFAKAPDPILVRHAQAAQRHAEQAAGATGKSKPSEEKLGALGLQHLAGEG